mmetsp:Transcript_594/g.1673  ORF Transcript_594/g.1673 Transcript_594/m.1673 type:complete len:231 (-) Transcript_594:1379-2071(-)
MAAQQDHAASSVAPLMMPVPLARASPDAPCGATFPPGCQRPSTMAFVRSTSPSTRIRQEDVRRSSAPRTPFVNVSSWSNLLQSASVFTPSVWKAAYLWPCESRQRPLPLKTTAPWVFTFSSMTSVASMPSATAPRAEGFWQMSKTQSWRRRRSSTRAHSSSAAASRSGGHSFGRSSCRASAARSPPVTSLATLRNLRGWSSPRFSKRLMDAGMGPRSSPTARFQEGATLS